MKFKLFSLILLIVCFSACQRSEPSTDSYYKISGPAQGTTYHLTIKSTEAERIQQKVDSLIEVIDQSLSTYRDDSYISAWNENRLSLKQLADIHFKQVLKSSFETYTQTEGVFDPTIGPLLEFYGFGSEVDRAIDERELQSISQIIGLDMIEVDDNGMVSKLKPEITLNFNANAQGYTVDQIALLLESEKINDYMVELGGEVKVAGLNPNGENWSIGIEKPLEGIEKLEGADRLEYALEMDSGWALATSGNYRNYRINEETGEKFGHIIDPISLKPVQSKLLSVTVVDNNCMNADALATALMAMGHEKALDYASKEQLNVIFILGEKEDGFDSFISPSLMQKIKILSP